MTSADGNGVYLTHEKHAALLAERDRLREVFHRLDLYLSSLPDEPVSVSAVDDLCAILHGRKGIRHDQA